MIEESYEELKQPELPQAIKKYQLQEDLESK